MKEGPLGVITALASYQWILRLSKKKGRQVVFLEWQSRTRFSGASDHCPVTRMLPLLSNRVLLYFIDLETFSMKTICRLILKRWSNENSHGSKFVYFKPWPSRTNKNLSLSPFMWQTKMVWMWPIAFHANIKFRQYFCIVDRPGTLVKIFFRP